MDENYSQKIKKLNTIIRKERIKGGLEEPNCYEEVANSINKLS